MAQSFVKTAYQQLIVEWEKPQKDLDLVETLCEEIKLACLEDFIPCEKTELEEVENFLTQQRTLEISALCSILRRDSKSFQRKMLQLKHYYMDTEFQKLHPNVEESPMKYEMMGLHLLCLLAENNRMQIHREIERLHPELALNNPFISFAVKLEECLTVGAYTKIFMYVANPPSPYCALFLETMRNTIRDEIATSVAKSFAELKVEDATKLLNFTGNSAVKDFQEYIQYKWKSTNDGKTYVFSSRNNVAYDVTKESVQMARDQLLYAQKLDMIV